MAKPRIASAVGVIIVTEDVPDSSLLPNADALLLLGHLSWSWYLPLLEWRDGLIRSLLGGPLVEL